MPLHAAGASAGDWPCAEVPSSLPFTLVMITHNITVMSEDTLRKHSGSIGNSVSVTRPHAEHQDRRTSMRSRDIVRALLSGREMPQTRKTDCAGRGPSVLPLGPSCLRPLLLPQQKTVAGGHTSDLPYEFLLPCLCVEVSGGRCVGCPQVPGQTYSS